jgi:flagellar secretion chaperone FliS
MNIQHSYREAMVRGASPVGLVMWLYEQMIEDLRQASIAIEQNDIERRTKRINHAILVIGHLQSSLEFVNGGKVARDLNHFYDALRQNLVQAQFYPSRRAISQQITDLLAVREAWMEVERAEKSLVTAAAVLAAPSQAPSVAADSESHHVRMDWRG